MAASLAESSWYILRASVSMYLLLGGQLLVVPREAQPLLALLLLEALVPLLPVLDLVDHRVVEVRQALVLEG